MSSILVRGTTSLQGFCPGASKCEHKCYNMAMESNQNDLLRETYELARENNKMLHGMRRRAFLGGLLKLIFWIALIVAPIWFYQAYLSPVVDSMLKSINQIGGASATAQSQFTELQNVLQKFQSQIPAVFQPK